MNALSVISVIIYTSFFIGALCIITAERKSILNISAAAVLISLGWWSFCNSFFFAASTIEKAWFWHRLSSIGWCSFVSIAAYYFLALTNYNKKKCAWWKHVLFFIPTIVLICKNLFGKTTSLAQKIVVSGNGFGLTYQNSITSFWLWAYLLYLVIYFGVTFALLYKWSKAVKHKMKTEMAIAFIVLDVITILFGFITDVILPLTSPILPALASIGTAFFGIGYFAVIYRHDVFNINVLISAEDILKTSHNPLFVVDENKEILKYNIAAGDLLGYNKSELIGSDFVDMTIKAVDFTKLSLVDNLTGEESKIRCKNGVIKDVIISASVAEDKQHNFLCMIISCQDITKQKTTQHELELQQEKYKKLADDYQKLANFDSLTGVPNHRCYFEVLTDYEKLYQTNKKDFAILFLDLDKFKHINDLYGHKVGDELLIATANKLKVCMDKNDFLARLGGDEFIIIMTVDDVNSTNDKLQMIENEFCKSILLNGFSYEIRFSAGCAMYSEVKDITKLMQVADKSMYENKKIKKLLNDDDY